jgi:hypothetical protein
MTSWDIQGLIQGALVVMALLALLLAMANLVSVLWTGRHLGERTGRQEDQRRADRRKAWATMALILDDMRYQRDLRGDSYQAAMLAELVQTVQQLKETE